MLGDIHFGTDSHCAFSAAAVAEKQIDVDDYVSPDFSVLSAEDRRTAAGAVTVAGIGKQDLFGRDSVGAYCFDNAVALIYEACAGDTGFHVKRQVVAVIGIARIKDFFASDVKYPAYGASAWQIRCESEILYGFHSLHMKAYGIVNTLYIDGSGSHIVKIAAETAKLVCMAADISRIVLRCTKTVHSLPPCQVTVL